MAARLDNGGAELGSTPLGAAVRSPRRQREAFPWIGAVGADGGARTYNPGQANGPAGGGPLTTGALGRRKGRKPRRRR